MLRQYFMCNITSFEATNIFKTNKKQTFAVRLNDLPQLTKVNGEFWTSMAKFKFFLLTLYNWYILGYCHLRSHSGIQYLHFTEEGIKPQIDSVTYPENTGVLQSFIILHENQVSSCSLQGSYFSGNRAGKVGICRLQNKILTQPLLAV